MKNKSYSWLIDGDIAVKEIDKSVVDHHGTGIPQDIREYWNCENMKEGEKKKVVLEFNGIEYLAHIELRENRTKLLWYSNLKDAAELELFSDEETRRLLKPYILFSKINKDKYGVEIVSQGIEFDKVKNITVDSSCYVEGRQKVYYSTKYERNGKCRQQAIEIHGCKCSVCGFDFEMVYGELGTGYIEIHHKKPLYSLEEEIVVDPRTDLAPVCSNCHRMLHRRRNRITTIEELKKLIDSSKLPAIDI